jgi:hypothetical protein
MGKPKFKHHPRSVVQKRADHPDTLLMTLQKPIVNQWQLQAGDIIEQVFVTEGNEQCVKLRKVV